MVIGFLSELVRMSCEAMAGQEFDDSRISREDEKRKKRLCAREVRMVYIWKVGCSTKIVRLQAPKQLPGTSLELLPEHVSRYDDAGPIRNSMDRPEQQNHPITRTSPSSVRPYSTVRPPPYVSDSITISSKPDAARGEEQLTLNRMPSPGERPATKKIPCMRSSEAWVNANIKSRA